MQEDKYPSWDEFDTLKAYITGKFIEQKMILEDYKPIEGTMVDTIQFKNEDGSKIYQGFISIRNGGFGFGVSDLNPYTNLINVTLPSINYKSVIDTLLTNSGLIR
jgi:hypothetical protein